MVRLVQLVRTSDCGPEGHRFETDIAPIFFADIAQRLVHQFAILGMRVRFPLSAQIGKSNCQGDGTAC